MTEKPSLESKRFTWYNKAIFYSLILTAVSCTGLRYDRGPRPELPDGNNEPKLASMVDAGDYFIKTEEWEKAIKHYNNKFELDGGGEWQDYFVMAFSHYQLAYQNFTMVGIGSDSFNDSFDSSLFSSNQIFGDMFLDTAVDNCWEARKYIAAVPEKHDTETLHGQSIGETREGIDFLCDQLERKRYGTELVR